MTVQWKIADFFSLVFMNLCEFFFITKFQEIDLFGQNDLITFKIQWKCCQIA